MKKIQCWIKGVGTNHQGVTLIELLAVLVIIGMVALITTPLLNDLIAETGRKARKANAVQIYEAARLYKMFEENCQFSGVVTLATLQSNKYLPSVVRDPKTGAVLNGENTRVNFDATGRTPLVILDTDSDDSSYLAAYKVEQLFSTE